MEGIDSAILVLLGIAVPKCDKRIAYAVRSSLEVRGRQLGADYYHPERVNALREIQNASNAKRVVKLSEIVEFKRDTEKEADPEKYIGLANIESNTGE